MEVGAIFDRNTRCANIADEHARLKDLNFCRGCDRAVDLAAGHEGAGGKNAFDDRLLSDNQSPGGVDFAFNAAVDADGPIKVENALEIDSFSKEREIIAVARVLSAVCRLEPTSAFFAPCDKNRRGAVLRWDWTGGEARSVRRSLPSVLLSSVSHD